MAGVMHGIRLAGGLEGLGLAKRHLGVLMVMAYFEDEVTGDCGPSAKMIGQLAGQNKSRVATNRTELEKMGLIIEIRDRRIQVAMKIRKFWRWNEQVFPKMKITNCNRAVANGEMQHLLHCTTLQEEEERISKVIDFPFLSQVLEEEEEEGQAPPEYVPVSTELAIARPVPGASSRQAEHLVLVEEEVGPKHPVMVCLVVCLKALGIEYPRKIEPWPTYETMIQQLHTPEELNDFPKILEWAFTRAHFRKAFSDPKKKRPDPILCQQLQRYAVRL
jgi:hypothetical protein